MLYIYNNFSLSELFFDNINVRHFCYHINHIMVIYEISRNKFSANGFDEENILTVKVILLVIF